MTKADMVDVIVDAYFPPRYEYGCAFKVITRKQQSQYTKADLKDAYDKALAVLIHRGDYEDIGGVA